jgi:predicted permease
MAATIRSLRPLRRHWKLAAIAAFSLSIAMALGVVALSFSNTFLILPPAAPAPNRLVMMYSRAPGQAIDLFSYPDFEYYRDHNHVFTDVAAAPNSIGINFDANFDGREVKVITRPVSENYFAVMGIRPHLGRLFAHGDDLSQAPIAVMTWACWKRLGSDPNIVGKVLTKRTIIGVTPKDFTGSFYGVDGDLFTTLREVDNDTAWLKQRLARRLSLIARLKPGVTRRQAQAEMAALSGQLASAYPNEDKGRAAVVTRATLLPPDAIPTAELMTAIVMTLVVLVLLIACANVANLLLAVAVGRRQEAAIKLALGAPRGRLIREFLKESTILCMVSGVLGYGFAALAIARYSDLTVALPGAGAFSFGLNLKLDTTVAAFTLLLVLIASIATGLAPALYAASPGLAQILSGEIAVGGTRKGVRRNALVIIQIAVCTLVLVAMGLCQSSLYNLRHVDPGFSARHLVAATIYLESEGYSEARGKQFYEPLRRTVSSLPDVESVSLASGLPLMGFTQVPVQLPDSVKTVSIAQTAVDTGYFSTFGIRMLAGRAFDSTDRESSPPVVVINHKMAEMFWPGRDPVGKTLIAGDPGRKVAVVGVAADGKYLDFDEPARPFLYYALSQHYLGWITVIARTRDDPRTSVEPLAQALRGLGLKVMIQPVTFPGWTDLTLFPQRITVGGVAVLSALGLLLSVIGLFGAISYSVRERRKELGIRVALGALPWQLLQMVLRQTLLIAGAGVAIGTLLGVGVTVVFRSQLYGISAIEWTVLVPVSAAMLALSLLVAYFSARPWVTIDPMDAVRHA